jgi:hypothetical protein
MEQSGSEGREYQELSSRLLLRGQGKDGCYLQEEDWKIVRERESFRQAALARGDPNVPRCDFWWQEEDPETQKKRKQEAMDDDKIWDQPDEIWDPAGDIVICSSDMTEAEKEKIMDRRRSRVL